MIEGGVIVEVAEDLQTLMQDEPVVVADLVHRRLSLRLEQVVEHLNQLPPFEEPRELGIQHSIVLVRRFVGRGEIQLLPRALERLLEDRQKHPIGSRLKMEHAGGRGGVTLRQISRCRHPCAPGSARPAILSIGIVACI